MEKILLDTNMLIYLEDNKILDTNVAKLTRILYDSPNFKIVIHPKSIKEGQKIKDKKMREIFLSKISVYKQIENPPIISEKFNNLLGARNENDKIDNELLFAVKQNCVSYFITNDIGIKKKSQIIGLENRVLKIEEAIEKFKSQEELNLITNPIFIKNDFLYQIELSNNFFNSLREDYKTFDDWFQKKQKKDKKAFITRNKEGEVTSFLMLKVENEKEEYNEFRKKFKPAKRIKISTFKVEDTGKRIGETFIKIIMQKAIIENVEEVYITIFPKYEYLINMFKQYGFKYFTYKNTENCRGEIKKEYVFVKKMADKNFYPFITIDKQNIFIIPVQPIYHELLFPETVKNFQISIYDCEALNTVSNAIKKSYISNFNTNKINSGDILLFYASRDRKSITSIGIVDNVFKSFENIEDMVNLVKKRTAYTDKELKCYANKDSLVIMFKHYISFSDEINYKELINEKIVNGYPQHPTKIEKEQLISIINKSQKDKKKFEIKI